MLAADPGRPGPAALAGAASFRGQAAGGSASRAGVAFVVASPQLIAMVQQARAGGAAPMPGLLALTGKRYGVAITDLFAPAQRVTHFGLDQLAAARPR